MNCPLCGKRNDAAFTVFTQERKGKRETQALRCSDCGLVYLMDYQDDRQHLYDGDYGAWGGDDADLERMVAKAKRQAFRRQLRHLQAFLSEGRTRLLDVGTGNGYLLDVAVELGLEAHGVELSAEASAKASLRHPGKIRVGTLEAAAYADGSFDVVAMTDIIEHIADPLTFFAEVARILRPGGLVFIITPNADSLTRKALGRHWFQYKYEHVLYWNPSSLTRLFDRSGFRTLLLRRNSKVFTLSYYHEYFRKYSFLPPLDRIFLALYRFLPSIIKDAPIMNPVTGEMLVIAEKT